jgi:tartrate dehydratase alpha subunit/fumarate hydratase class I-like protein
MQFLESSLLELITQTSSNLPPDVRAALGMVSATETPHTQSAQALSIIATNIDMAQEEESPICQDTGMPTFVIHTPVGVNQILIKKAIRKAVAEATKRGKLRPNSVDSLTGKNSGAARIVIWKACANVSCTPYGRRRAKVARPEPSESASAATALTAMTSRKTSCSARSTM